MYNKVELDLMHLTPDTIRSIIMDLSELEQTWSIDAKIAKLMAQLVNLVGEAEAEEMIGELTR